MQSHSSPSSSSSSSSSPAILSDEHFRGATKKRDRTTLSREKRRKTNHSNETESVQTLDCSIINASNGFHKLPYEMLIQVLSYVSQYDLLLKFGLVSRECHKWSRDSHLWRKVVLSAPIRSMTQALGFLHSIGQNAQIRSLSISSQLGSLLTARQVNNFVRKCPTLVELKICGSPSEAAVCLLSRKLPTLSKLSLPHACLSDNTLATVLQNRPLRSLTVACPLGPLTQTALVAFCCSTLEHLDWRICSRVVGWNSTISQLYPLSSENILDIVQSCGKLTSLNVDGVKVSDGNSLVPSILSTIKSISVFSFHGCTSLTSLCLPPNSGCSSLQSLSFFQCQSLETLQFSQSSETLRDLDLTETKINDSSIEGIVQKVPNLVHLRLGKCIGLTNPIIRFSKLVSLDVWGCSSIESLVIDCPNLCHLEQEGAPIMFNRMLTSLTNLEITSHRLQSFDLQFWQSKSLSKLSLDCAEIKHLSIESTSLQKVSLHLPRLTEAKFSNAPYLMSSEYQKNDSNNKKTFFEQLSITSTQLQELSLIHNHDSASGFLDSFSNKRLLPDNAWVDLRVLNLVNCSLSSLAISHPTLQFLNIHKSSNLIELNVECDALESLSIVQCTNLLKLQIQCVSLILLELLSCSAIGFQNSSIQCGDFLRILKLKNFQAPKVFIESLLSSNAFLSKIYIEDILELHGDFTILAPFLQMLRIQRCQKLSNLVVRSALLSELTLEDCCKLEGFETSIIPLSKDYETLLLKHNPTIIAPSTEPLKVCLQGCVSVRVEKTLLPKERTISLSLLQSLASCETIGITHANIVKLVMKSFSVSHLELTCPRLTHLELCHSRDLRELKLNTPSLQVFMLEWCCHIGLRLPNLTIATQLTKIKISQIHHVRGIDQWISSLSNLSKLSDLELVGFHWALTPVISHKTLTRCAIRGSYSLSEVSVVCPQLRALDLSQNIALHTLILNTPNLLLLNLAGNERITDQSFLGGEGPFKKSMKISVLRKLELQGTSIGEETLEKLKDMFPSLVFVGLSHCKKAGVFSRRKILKDITGQLTLEIPSHYDPFFNPPELIEMQEPSMLPITSLTTANNFTVTTTPFSITISLADQQQGKNNNNNNNNNNSNSNSRTTTILAVSTPVNASLPLAPPLLSIQSPHPQFIPNTLTVLGTFTPQKGNKNIPVLSLESEKEE